jgi:hypothetical protein
MKGLAKDRGPAVPLGAKRVDSIVQALADGRPVSPALIAEAKRQLLSELRSTSGTKQAEAGEQLSKLYRNLKTRKDQSQLAGELLVSGPAGARVLEREINDRHPLSKFKKLAGLPLSEQLLAVTDILAGLLGSSRPNPQSKDPLPDPDQRETAIRQKEEEEKKRALLGDGPPDIDWEGLVKDSSQPASVRSKAVEHLSGEDAVNVLIELLLKPRADADLEFGVQALRTLSRTGAASAIRRELEILSTSGHRDLAEYLNDVLGSTSHLYHRAGPASANPIPDTWLRQAIRQGDQPGILQAGLGREMLAIPLIMSYWADLSPDWN